jgi:predicted nucleic acid-binding protein
MLLDSNIVIYAARPEHALLRQFIAEHAPSVSAISYVECLGYHALKDAERAALESFFSAADMLPVTQDIIQHAAGLRQQRRMSLGDSLIAGTARVHQLSLVTHNVADFQWIEGLRVVDPLAP